MKTVSLNEAQRTLAELIHRLAPGEVVTITENDRPVARLAPISAIQGRPLRPRPPVTGIPKAGALEGRLQVPDDFKEPLEEMREYME
ncbi:MAG TPA: type II toxin-antitoxin system prevent-host-death family antitoxin [Gemmataceae bacterium]|nr:type II toxin-antitoxin system prevent-host-death family antitoxin [Gemmataceae bacterium]